MSFAIPSVLSKTGKMWTSYAAWGELQRLETCFLSAWDLQRLENTVCGASGGNTGGLTWERW